jgi:hypothetical protein
MPGENVGEFTDSARGRYYTLVWRFWQGEMQSLHRFLIDYDMAMLRALAQNRGVDLVTNRQIEAAAQMAAALLDPLSVRVALARLSVPGREALDTLLAAGGKMRAPQFARRFGQVRPIGPGRLEREAPWREPANAHEELFYLGLLFRGFYDDEGGPGEFVFVPADLLPLLPRPRVEAAPFAIDVVPPPPDHGAGNPVLVGDLFAYLVYLQTHDVRPYADGRLGQRDLAALSGRLAGADERRLAFLRHLAGRLDFVVRKDQFLRLKAGPVKQWLSALPARQLAVLQEAWRDDPEWNDLCQVPGLACDQAGPWHPRYDPVAVRRAILALLALCPPDAWWTLSSFLAAVKSFHPDFQRPDGDYTSWYIRDAASGGYLSGFELWDRVEGALLADLLAGPLQWLGVVITVTGKAGAVCRLTEAGARFLDLLPGAAPAEPWPPIAVHPDFDILVPSPINLYTCFQLERLADPVDPPRPNRHAAQPCRYRLTVDSLGRALARGIEGEQVLAFLRQASDDHVPANVAGQIQMWAGRFGQVRVEEVAVLWVKNERVLKELSVLPETRAFIARVLSPTSALVRRKDLAHLRRELRALGYLPPEESVGDPTERD